jgi:cephalosporin hydroxylase
VDDRAEFEQTRRRNVENMARDGNLQAAALAATTIADRHDYSYVWTWLGLPIIQMPTDVVALQEVVWATRPTVIVETGVARGGSVIFFASLLQLLGEGEVIGIDIDIRAHNRSAIEEHALSHRVQLVEGSSVDEGVVARIRDRIPGDARVMVILDSNHTHEHVLRELELYGGLVTPGQFLVVADTIVESLPPQTHRPRPWGPGDNPHTAVEAFLAAGSAFERDPYFNGKLLMTSSPGGYLRRTS